MARLLTLAWIVVFFSGGWTLVSTTAFGYAAARKWENAAVGWMLLAVACLTLFVIACAAIAGKDEP